MCIHSCPILEGMVFVEKRTECTLNMWEVHFGWGDLGKKTKYGERKTGEFSRKMKYLRCRVNNFTGSLYESCCWGLPVLVINSMVREEKRMDIFFKNKIVQDVFKMCLFQELAKCLKRLYSSIYITDLFILDTKSFVQDWGLIFNEGVSLNWNVWVF